jgi:hypothetical protein
MTFRPAGDGAAGTRLLSLFLQSSVSGDRAVWLSKLRRLAAPRLVGVVARNACHAEVILVAITRIVPDSTTPTNELVSADEAEVPA